MNSSMNVQSPSFGAHRYGNIEKFYEALNNLTTEERHALSKQIAKARRKLANTKYADAVTYVRENGNIIHRCECKHPQMQKDGTIVLVSSIGVDFPSLRTVISQTKAWEKNAQKVVDSFHAFESLV